MQSSPQITTSNPLELEAQADELEAEALRLRAQAKRARAAEPPPAAMPLPTPTRHETRTEYARRSAVSEATVSRWLAEGMPALPVGSTVRIDPIEADQWRRARGRRPTKAPAKIADVEVDDVLSRAGLRAVRGGR